MHLKLSFLSILTSLLFANACLPVGNEERQKADVARNGAGAALVEGSRMPGGASANSAKYNLEYSLSAASAELRLPRALREVSGLSLSADGAYLLAVNDEQGKAFFLDKKRGRILRELSFGEAGDYEGLEMVGNTIYVVRSDGVIYEFEYTEKADPVSKTHHTPLNADYDVEGLGYDPANRRLLVACKGKAGEGKDYEDKRGVYAFSLDSMKLSAEPVFLLSEDMPVAEEAFREAWWSDALAGHFVPSAIAVHPITGHIYILSSKGKARAVLVMKPSGELLSMRELNKDPFNQPEGICFEPDGAMYISTEAKGKRGKGKIFRFERR